MGETNSPSVAHVGYNISPLSRVEKYRNPWATEGESIYLCFKMSLWLDREVVCLVGVSYIVYH